MKWFAGICAIAVLAAATTARAGTEVKSGPQEGDKIGPFDVVKCAGATDDGVSVGDKLCYRCKYGAKPMVMVFTRKSDEIAGLVKKLDKAVEKNSDKQLRAFVNIIGEDRKDAESCAKSLAKDNSVENVPIVVPEESTNGPDDYGINPDAVVTVIVAREGKVVASHGYTSIPDSDDIKQIMHDVHKAVE
ncbi:MAG TPA: hypothetical protein VHY91_20295 [Pirellulales bacterium]|jgi:hypothetical protein|nr:hypothetical protein [Pirellulales bacterium]HEX4145857.1 hypothetical protein [Pirellulales bacterium]